MRHIREHHRLGKVVSKLPLQVIRRYELWKSIVFRHGPDKLREFPDFHDEKLKGEYDGQRSSLLNIQYRGIYSVEEESVSVYVVDITSHKY